ncbi:leucine-rich repeat domain-containing protein [Larkinella insperata]|uniref:Leucine-rich repeat domain-containing protein n=1 Tax=Larkinella insperata TaxID=332158 RepID=A0ABW3QN95_9BACT|nr:leucine-rich repeat domain-containing protein [Larkinella insperata]
MRIFLGLAFYCLVVRVSAQDRLLSDSELDVLVTWNPVYKPKTAPEEDFYQKYPSPTSYKNLAELVGKADRQPIQSLQVNLDVLKAGNVERLAELKDVRVLSLEVDSLTSTEALWRAVSQLKRLQRLSIAQVNSGKVGRVPAISLPASLQQLAEVERLEVTLWEIDRQQTFAALAGMPKLRKLIFSGYGDLGAIPSELGNVRQLTSLTIHTGRSSVSLPASLGDLTKLRELTLNYLPLNPDQNWTFLGKLTELEILKLAGTNLQTVPDLGQLKKLKEVDLQMNRQLTFGKETLNGLSALEKLNLAECQLRELPSAMTEWKSLKELILNNNPLGELPVQLGSLKQLNVLQATGCQLRKVPGSLGELTQLKSLMLAGNQLDTLGFDFDKLGGITLLTIYSNQLRYLPPSIGRLTALVELDLSNNKLVQLPETIGDLTNLTNLSLQLNPLTALPARLGKLEKLRRLDVAENQLQRLPAEIGQLRKLQQLALSSNKLTQLPESMSGLDSLQWVDLSSNQLEEVPGVLFRMTGLRELNLNNNKLSSIPAALGQLSKLTYLALNSNRIAVLPRELGKLTKLQTLLVGQNPLELLPESIGQCRELTFLHAGNTKLKVLPSGLGQLTKLQNLELFGNELTILPASLGNLTKLQSLYLGRTRLLALPESIGRLTQLHTLQIGDFENASETEYAGLQQLPDSIVYCQNLKNLFLANQTGLDGDDTFAKVRQLKKLFHLTLFHCNLERLPAIDWKSFPVHNLNLGQNRLTELPVDLLESPNLRRIELNDNLLPKPLNTNFHFKEHLRLAMAEAGLIPMEKIAKPNQGVASTYVQNAFRMAGQRNWTEAFANFDKAIEYAPDTMQIVLFAQRADMHAFRQNFPEAVADYNRSIQLNNKLTGGVPSQDPLQKLQFDQPFQLALRGRANAKAKLGQIDAALVDITVAVQRFTAVKGDPQLGGSLLTEQGRYLMLKNKVAEAKTSYRKAIEEYGKASHAHVAVKLTVVELNLMVGQPDQARIELQRIEKRELGQGFATLEKYLESSIQVLKREKPNVEILTEMSNFVSSHAAPIYGWSFELYENWLTHSGLPPEQQTALQQLTQLTKGRLPKLE